MADKRIWAPWRIGYVSGEDASRETSSEISLEPTSWQPGADHDCFLCRGAARYDDESSARRQNLVVWRGKHVYALLNRYPYANGHLLVAPLQHVAELRELTDPHHLEVMHFLSRYTEKLRQLLHADGFNIGLNLGATAGAGVPGHLHWHLVPRWPGDHNFMPVINDTMIISEHLEKTYERLLPFFEKHA